MYIIFLKTVKAPQFLQIHNSQALELRLIYIVFLLVIDFQALLEAPDDIYSFKFNPSDPNIIAGGCINGQVRSLHTNNTKIYSLIPSLPD